MAKILYWNIADFTNNKISAAPSKRQKLERADTEARVSSVGLDHLNIILTTLLAVDPMTGAPADLDFIVIVEVEAGAMEGQLVDGSGREGCISLLNEFNSLPGLIGSPWALVPPVATGVGGPEGIAVFYRSDRWYFLGPKFQAAAYPNDLEDGLPNRNIPINYPYTPGVGMTRNERHRVGSYEFGTWQPGMVPPHNAGLLVQFPGANQRKPWLTCFGDITNHNRLIRLMAIHTKPNERSAVGIQYASDATRNLADIYTMTAAPPDAADQTDVILGDFNVDNLDANNFQAGRPFGRLVGQGMHPVNPAYTALIMPPAMLNPDHNSYYHTHGRPITGSAEEEAARIVQEIDEPPFQEPVGHYPGQEYSNASIDNALVRYHVIGPHPNHNLTILARARALPYNPPVPAPVPVMPLLGHYQSPTSMNRTIEQLYADIFDPLVTESLNGIFLSWDNYGKIRSTSDHFALLFDV